ncbi:hypothetical protein CK203_006316 [Vitis vinifera]|uniref:Uncharacterized protein n=1 Tax=Vitis vinifera TaxID=29760 RepID=A0A438KBF7_VITVI|nr:hypothetical protein CK203_006316 [Vitis vinifera]
MKEKQKEKQEENRGQKLQSSLALLEHFRSPFFTCYIPFQSSGSQQSNALNHVQFGAEMRRYGLWKTTAQAVRNFAQHLPNSHTHLACFSKYGCYVMAWMQSHGNFSHPEVISYELLEGEVFNSKFCINPLEPISMAIESCACHIEYEIAEEAMHFMSYVAEVSMVREMFGHGRLCGAQKSINAHLSQRIDSVESSLNKRMDEVQNDLSQKIDNLQYSIQGSPISRLIREIFTIRMLNRDTLKSGKELIWPHPNKSMKQSMNKHETEKKKREEIKERERECSIAIIQCKSLMKDANFIWIRAS